MLRAALRDLQWRRKRFMITILGTALVFAMSLVMSGLSNSFSVEVDRTLDRMGADWWVTRSDAAGAFSPGSFLTTDDVNVLTGPGMGFSEASPVLYGSTTVQTNPGSDNSTVVTVTVLGVVPEALGAPQEVDEGTTDLAFGQVIVPRSLGRSVGDSITVAGAVMSVGGVLDEASLLGGTPTIHMRIEEAQRLLLGGQPLASMVVAKGAADLPGTYTAYRQAEAKADLMRPLENPMQAIDFVKVLLWIVAGLIIASVVYLNVLERTRDIAVFKATGVGSGAIAGGIVLQAVLVSIVASIVGIGLAFVIVPFFPMEVDIGTSSMLLLPLLAVVVGSFAGLVGVRRTATVAPATAFGGP
jgi:putative ABC transport system permease protein